MHINISGTDEGSQSFYYWLFATGFTKIKTKNFIKEQEKERCKNRYFLPVFGITTP
jgi:hypothetical protein